MKDYFRVLSYLKPYRKRFLLGIGLALIASVFNGVSLTALKPVFDILQAGADKPYQLSMDKKEVEILSREYSERITPLITYQKYKAEPQPAANALVQSDFLKKKTALIKLKVNEFLVQFSSLKVMMAVAFLVLPIYLLRLVSILGTVALLNSAGLLAVRDWRREFYGHMLELPLSLLMREKSGTLISRMVNDISVVTGTVSTQLQKFVFNFFILITHLAMLAIVSYKLLLITLIGVPIIILPVNQIARRIRHGTKKEQQMLGDINGHMQEIISGVRVVRAFGMEDYTSKGFDQINGKHYEESFRNRYNHTLAPALVEFASSIIVVGLIVYGGFLILNGEMTSGSFFLFLFTMMVIMSPLKQIANYYGEIQRASAAAGRVFDLMQMEREVEDTSDPVSFGKIRKSIEFDQVSFHYEGSEKNVLQKIKLKVPVGTTTALVGHSGAGKSTLVDLIPRFYDPADGAILVDGLDIRRISLKEWRSRIAIVTQDVFLFNGTIAENIAYGRTDVSKEEIEKAAKMAYADEFVEKLPEKYETKVGERGLMLSGGQRQRISIARALLKNPEILILDEATSALDTRSERLVQKALTKLMKNRTTFVIAHRLSTVFQADQIVVVSKGKIVEKGTHQVLLKKGGQYKKLYSMQFQD